MKSNEGPKQVHGIYKENSRMGSRETYYKVQTTVRGEGMNGARVEIPETV